MTTRILAARALPTLRAIRLRDVVMVIAFAVLAINPVIHPLELLVLIPLAAIARPRFRWMVPTMVLAIPAAVIVSHRILPPTPSEWAWQQLAITRHRVPLTAAQQGALLKQYEDWKRVHGGY